MAISEKKLAANRANARRSTGPRTPSGKATIARNAMLHGLTARGSLLPGDDPREYQRFGQRIFNELEPAGALQEELAEEIVNLSWKLRRVPGAESVLLVEKHGDGDPPLRVICKMILSRRSWDHSPDSPLWLLDRYAARIERARATALRMLLALQKRHPNDQEEDEDDRGSETAPDEQPGLAGAGSENAPRQNKPTAGADHPEAQPVVSASDAILVSPAAGEPATPSKATAVGGDSSPGSRASEGSMS